MKLYSNVTIIFCIWVLSIFTIFYFGFFNIKHADTFQENFTFNLANWDGGHYLGIAKNGYSEKFQYAFFPLYPLLIKLLTNFTNDYLLSAILISIFSTFFAVQLLYKFISANYERKLAEKVILALLFFPTSFYFLTAYSEGLFLLLTVSTCYFFRQKKFLLTAIFASLASATRLVGLALVLGLIIEVIITEGINKKNWIIFLSPLGFFIYCYFLYTQTGDPFYFLVAELHWQRNLSLPIVGFWDTIKAISIPGYITSHLGSFFDLIFTIFGLGLSIRAFRFLPSSLAIYSFFSILLPLLTPTLSSVPRFMLVIFPIFILLAMVKNRFFDLGYQMISLMLLSIFAVLFINGYWVS